MPASSGVPGPGDDSPDDSLGAVEGETPSDPQRGNPQGPGVDDQGPQQGDGDRQRRQPGLERRHPQRDLQLQDLIRRTGVEIDYRYKLESIDLWETVVITNNKSALTPMQHATLAA